MNQLQMYNKRYLKIRTAVNDRITLKIERMNKGEWGKIKAFFYVTTEEGFVIKGFKSELFNKILFPICRHIFL